MFAVVPDPLTTVVVNVIWVGEIFDDIVGERKLSQDEVEELAGAGAVAS